MKQTTETQLNFTLDKQYPTEFQNVFKAFFDSLCRAAQHLTGDWEQSQSIVLEIFLKLWKRTNGDLSSYLDIRSYLYISVRNECIKYKSHIQTHRKRLREISTYLSDYVEDDVQTQRIRSEVFQSIELEIERLPKKCRRVLKLSIFKDMSITEIASYLGLSRSTVSRQRDRAIRLLKEAFAGKSWEVMF